MLQASTRKISNPDRSKLKLIHVPRRQQSTLPSALPLRDSRMRKFSTISLSQFWPRFRSEKPKERIVIIGSGWAGFKLIKGLDKERYDVHLISPNNYFTFTPLLPSTSVGTLEFRSAIEPVRNAPGLNFSEAKCKQIDFDNKFVTCTSSHTSEDYTMPYDKLVIACGATSNTFNIPGVKEHACFLKDITHARKIRSRLLQCFELASQPTTTEAEIQQLLHFVCVGAGPTGIEFCSELYDFINDDISKRYPHLRKQVRLTIYDVAPKILPTFDEKLSNYTLQQFEKRGINVQTGKAVSEVHASSIQLKDGSEVPYGLLLWSTGLAPNDLIKSIDLPKDRMKRLLTSPSLALLDGNGKPMPDVYALGDCATIPENDLPCTAQVAKQKAEYLVKAFNSSRDLAVPFKYNHRGAMAYVGEWKAVVDLGNDGPNQKGLLGWLIWRTAYMTMADSLRNKIKIPTYWALTFLLGRETSRF